MTNDIKLDINIFEQLNQLELKSHHHKGFVLAYMCATQLVWLEGGYYRKKTKYSDLLKMIGFSEENPNFSYLTKKGGLLDESGIVTHSKDFPVKTNKTGEALMYSQLPEEKQKKFSNAQIRNFRARKPNYLYTLGQDEQSLLSKKKDFILITKKEFEECVKTGGSNLLILFCFIKIKQFKKRAKNVTITHADFKEQLGFSTPKLTSLIKHLQNSSIIHLSRETHRSKKELIYRLNNFTVISLLSKAELTELMNQPKESVTWG